MLSIDDTVTVMLKEYPEQVRFLRTAEYVDPYTLRGNFRSDPGWSYSGRNGEKTPVNHFTLTESAFAHNQMAYTILAYMAQQGHLQGVKPLSLNIMNEKKFNDMLIIQYEASFRRAFPSSELFTGDFSISSQSLRRTRTGIYVFTDNAFQFGGGKAHGTSKSVIRIEENELSRYI